MELYLRFETPPLDTPGPPPFPALAFAFPGLALGFAFGLGFAFALAPFPFAPLAPAALSSPPAAPALPSAASKGRAGGLQCCERTEREMEQQHGGVGTSRRKRKGSHGLQENASREPINSCGSELTGKHSRGA